MKTKLLTLVSTVVVALASSALAQGTVVSWSSLVMPENLGPVKDITGDEDWTGEYAVVLKADGSLAAWGSSGNAVKKYFPSGLRGVKAISGGRDFCLALMDNGTVTAWGKDGNRAASEIPPGLTDIQAVEAGGYHALALKKDGTVVAWGDNWSGQADVPRGLSGVVAVAAGEWMSAALRSDGTVVCWGQNLQGLVTTPAGLAGVKAIAAGHHVFVALKNNGRVVTWGKDWGGVGVEIPEWLDDAVGVASGMNESLILRRDGSVMMFNGFYPVPGARAKSVHVLGQQFYIITPTGTLLAGGPNNRQLALQNRSNAAMISAGLWHSVAIGAEGTVWGAGERRFGQGNPYDLPRGKKRSVVQIDSARNYDLALFANGTLELWGSEHNGLEDFPDDLDGVTAVAAGEDHALVLKKDGTVLSWGGTVHSGARLDVPAALRDPATARVRCIAAGDWFSAAYREGGYLEVWGGTTWESPPLESQQTHTDIIAMAGGARHLIALRANGTVVGWGEDGAGQISIPAGLTDVVAISAGGHNSMALRRNGTVVTWGAENTVPPGLSGVTAISAGPYHSMALVGSPTKKSQKVVFPPLRPVVFGVHPFVLRGTCDSRLPITYTSTNPAVAEVSGSVVTVKAAGSTTIRAEQPGDNEWSAAAPVERILVVAKRPQRIAFSPRRSIKTGEVIDLRPTINSTLPVTVTSSDPTVVVIEGTKARALRAGSVVLTASQDGDDNHTPAAPVAKKVTVL